MRLVFLDIDGVLNGHEFDVGAQSCRIQPHCIVQLNRLIKETGCKFVLSSAWRYMLLDREDCPAAMTMGGFEYLLRTHGAVGFKLIGTTCSDEAAGWSMQNNVPVRGLQIRLWMNAHGKGVEKYVVVDDEDFGITEEGHPLVQTRGDYGMSEADCSRLIEALN